MLKAKRTLGSIHLAGLFALAILGLGGGCAETRDSTAGGGESSLSGPKPAASCEQYLALLSDERKQPLLAQYGTGGSCWTGGKEQAAQCDETCADGVNQIIRSNLNKNNG